MSLISFKRIVQATCCGVKRCNKNVLIICCYKLENRAQTHTHSHTQLIYVNTCRPWQFNLYSLSVYTKQE